MKVFIRDATLLVAALLVADASALFFNKPSPVDIDSDVIDEKWSNLKITFGLELWQKNIFKQLPRDMNIKDNDDVKEWNQTLSEDCTNGGKFNGFRRTIGNDTSVTLLFDVNGIVAGIQMNVLKSMAKTPGNDYEFDQVAMYQSNTINGEEYYSLTAYFVDPQRICSTGRTADDLKTEGTGTGLYYQNGPTPNDLIHVPRHKEKAVQEGWTTNKCFLMMGYHTFFQVDKFQETQCRLSRPAFILYNKKGEMHGLGFQVSALIKNQRFENPPKTAIKLILGDTPKCVEDAVDKIGYTTMHVYFVNNPALITCPIF